MRRTIALLVAAVVIALSALGAIAFAVSSRSNLGLALGEAVLLVAIGAVRIFLAMALGPLQKRRAFDPDRVREAPSASLGWPYWLALGGAALLVASLVRGWLDFLDGQTHPTPAGGAYLVWIFVALIGVAVVAAAFVRDREGALRASGIAGVWLSRLTYAASRNFDRFIVAPLTEIAVRSAERWIPVGDGAVGSALATSGRLIVGSARLPAVPVVLVIAVILTLVVGFVSPGVFR